MKEYTLTTVYERVTFEVCIEVEPYEAPTMTSPGLPGYTDTTAIKVGGVDVQPFMMPWVAKAISAQAIKESKE